MGKKMTKKGAIQVTSALDNLAQLFEDRHSTMGVPARVAKEFALRCDLLADFIEKKAGLKKALTGDDPVKEPGFNPEEVGEEVGGPIEGDGDESYMDDEFTQQENRELRERVEDGDLGMTPVEDEQKPQPGKQANFTLAAAVDALNRGITAAVGKMSDAEVTGYIKDLTAAEAQLGEIELEIAKVAGELLKRKEDLEASHKKMLDEFGDKLPETVKGEKKKITELRECLFSYTKVSRENAPSAKVFKEKSLEQIEVQLGAAVRKAVSDIMDVVNKENMSITKASLKDLAYSVKTGAQHEAGVMDFLTAVGNFFSKIFKPLVNLFDKAASVIKRSVDNATDIYADYEKAMKAVGKTAAEDGLDETEAGRSWNGDRSKPDDGKPYYPGKRKDIGADPLAGSDGSFQRQKYNEWYRDNVMKQAAEDETDDQVEAEDEEVKKEASFSSKIDLFA
jgi:hypothetical protein